MNEKILKSLKNVDMVLEVFKKMGCEVEGNFVTIDGKDYEVFKKATGYFMKNKTFIPKMTELLETLGLTEKFEDNCDLEKKEKEKVMDLVINDFIPAHGRYPIKMNGSAVYVWNGKNYELFNVEKMEEKLYGFLRRTLGFVTKEILANAEFILTKEVSVNATDYYIDEDMQFLKKVALAFNNGTLYIYENGEFEFDERHRPDDRLFFSFNFDFHEHYLEEAPEYSIIREWWDVRFENAQDRAVALASYCDLFVTQSQSQFMCFLYGTGGTGKSQLEAMTRSFISKGCVSSVNVEDLNKEFKTSQLFSSIMNFSSEIERSKISSSRFKSYIARDNQTLAVKFQNDRTSKPIAKWFAFANNLPTMHTDSGVMRRIGLIETTSTLIREDLDKNSFAVEMLSDKHGFMSLIFEGINLLFRERFDISGFYSRELGMKYLREMQILNNSLAFFVDECLEATEDKMEFVSKKEMFIAFESFRKTKSGIGIEQMKEQTFHTRMKEMGIGHTRLALKDKKGWFYSGYKMNSEFYAEYLKKIGDFL